MSKPQIRKLYSKPVIIILFVLIILFAKGTWSIYQKESESRKNANLVKAELSELIQRKEALERQSAKLSTLEGREEVIREKYQVSKEGEKVLVIVEKPLPINAEAEDRSFFFKMWDSVSGIWKRE